MAFGPGEMVETTCRSALIRRRDFEANCRLTGRAVQRLRTIQVWPRTCLSLGGKLRSSTPLCLN
jgi:hypothetical protein